MQTNQQKQTKTYGLVGFDAPFRQGRSLSLPTLPRLCREETMP